MFGVPILRPSATSKQATPSTGGGARAKSCACRQIRGGDVRLGEDFLSMVHLEGSSSRKKEEQEESRIVSNVLVWKKHVGPRLMCFGVRRKGPLPIGFRAHYV